MGCICIYIYFSNPVVSPSLQSDSLGTILDLRNKETCPSLRNISKWPSSKIKETCILAYEKQMEALAEAGQERTKLFRTLRDELRTVRSYIDSSHVSLFSFDLIFHFTPFSSTSCTY